MIDKFFVHLMGPVRVSWEIGEPPKFRSQRTKALLGYIAVEKRPVSRDVLATFFWPDETISKAKANLRKELYNLNNILPGCWQTDVTIVQFNSGEGVQIDIDELERLARNQQWSEAAELIRGDFLEGIYLDDNLEFETWLLGERERRRQQAEAVLTAAAQAKQQQGNYPQARRFLTRLLQLVPWHEAGHRQMMRLLAYEGNFSAALKQYENCWIILSDELNVFPSATTTQLNERIKTAMSMPPHNLPPPATPFIGREEEIAALIKQMADPDCRLLTLTGVGGVGKTRLAQEIVRQVASNDFRLFLHGVAFVALTGINNHDLITAVGSGLGIVYSGQQLAEEQLVEYLRDMELLIFLDNYEHLLSDTDLLSTILREAPEVNLLVTSRERLNLQEEWLYEVEGLPYPVREMEELDEAEWTNFAAVTLFTACAKRTHRPIPLADMQNEVVRLCRLVQGMPLALELSAARLRMLTLADVLAELERGLDILSVETRNISARHSSMRVTFDASWQGLTESEQKVLSQLSLFRGGCTRQAAFEVAGATVAVLTNLTDKSLIRLTQNGRYEIHELLRQYSAEKLAADAKLEAATLERFATYYGDFLRDRGQRLLETDQVNTLQEMIPETDNIRFAWRWLVKNKKIKPLNQALWPLAFFHILRGQTHEGLALVEETLADVSQTKTQNAHYDLDLLLSRLQLFQGTFLHYTGSMDQSHALLVHNLKQLRLIGTKQDICWNIAFHGYYSLGLIAPDRPSEHIEEGLATAGESGPRWLLGFLAAQLARILLYSEDPTLGRIERLISDAVAIGRQLTNPWVLCHALLVDGRYELKLGRYSQAEQTFHQALILAQEINSLWLMGLAYSELGFNAYTQHQFADAKKYNFESMLCFRRMGARRWLTYTYNGMGEFARIEGKYDEAILQYEACLETSSELDDPYNIAASLNLGHVLLRLSRLEEAKRRFQYSLSNLLQMLQGNSDPGTINRRFWRTGSLILAGVAGILVVTGQPIPASRLMGAATAAQISAAPHALHPTDEDDWNRILTQVEAVLDNETAIAAWNEGKEMSLEEAITYALAVVEETMPKF